MTKHRLGDFILDNLEPILQAWKDFARTIEPPALTMDDAELRDHAMQMLQAFANDLAQPQSDNERSARSRGLGKRGRADTAAEAHAEARLISGYSVVQLVSEYRALRASVLTLWAVDAATGRSTDLEDVNRFNEAVDQALAESVARYQSMVKQSQNMFLAILDAVVVAINNRGPLIPPDKLAGIFDPLVRIASSLNTDYTERTSLGIGLFISREIVQAHGGQLTVSSTAQEGTTFTLALPRRHGD